MKEIYLDHAATTYLDDRVLVAMQPYFAGVFANPSSFHTPGMRAKEAVANARESIATILNAHEDEIIFTSGGTESNNLAISGVIEGRHSEGVPYENIHVITSPLEHSSVLECLRMYEKRGVKISFAEINGDGTVSVESIAKKITSETVLVSIM